MRVLREAVGGLGRTAEGHSSQELDGSIAALHRVCLDGGIWEVLTLWARRPSWVWSFHFLNLPGRAKDEHLDSDPQELPELPLTSWETSKRIR